MIDSGRLFPHKTFDELTIRPDDVTLTLRTGKMVSVKARPAIAVQPNEFHLFAEEDVSDWTKLQLRVRVLAQENAIVGLLPAGSDLAESTTMLVSALCVATKTRRRIFLTPDGDKPGEWYGSIDLANEDLADAIDFAPVLSRKTRFPGSAKDADGLPLATYPGAIIAFGESIRVFADQPKEDQNGSFKVTWEDFEHSTNEWRRSHCTEMFFVDTSAETPQVFLNSKHDLLKQTLMKKRPRASEAAIKAAIIAYIAHTTWATLFLAAIKDCGGADNEPPTWPSDAVKTKVLRKILPLLVPEHTDDEARRDYAVDLFQDRDSSRFGTLLTKLHSAVQGLIKIDNYVVKTLEATAEGDS